MNKTIKALTHKNYFSRPSCKNRLSPHDYQKNSFFLPYSQRLELSSWWSCSYIDPWAVQGLHLTINYVCGTPSILVKASRDPSVRSRRHFSILI